MSDEQAQEPKSTLDILKELSSQDSETESSNTEPEIKSSEEPNQSPDLKESKAPELKTEGEEKPIEIKRKPGRPRKQLEQAPKEPEPILDPVIPPRSLSKDELEDFKQAPRKMQEYIARRERERERGVQAYVQKLAHEARANDTYREAIVPHEAILKRYNLEPAEFIERMVQWDQGMQVDPVNVGRQFLAQYGLQPEHLIGRPGQPGQQMQPPQQRFNVAQAPEFQALQEKLGQVESMFAKQKEAQVLQTIKTVDQLQNEWRQQKDADGNLTHPYVDELEETMAPLVSSLRNANPRWNIATILDRAYMLALEDAPEIKGILTERQQALAKRKQIAEETKRAQTMRKGSVGIGPQSGTKMHTDLKNRDTRSILHGLAAGEIEPL